MGEDMLKLIDFLVETLRSMVDQGMLTKEAFLYILDRMTRFQLAKELGYESIPEPDPDAINKLIGILKEEAK